MLLARNTVKWQFLLNTVITHRAPSKSAVLHSTEGTVSLNTDFPSLCTALNFYLVVQLFFLHEMWVVVTMLSPSLPMSVLGWLVWDRGCYRWYITRKKRMKLQWRHYQHPWDPLHGLSIPLRLLLSVTSVTSLPTSMGPFAWSQYACASVTFCYFNDVITNTHGTLCMVSVYLCVCYFLSECLLNNEDGL
jgi:hypothetical protein